MGGQLTPATHPNADVQLSVHPSRPSRQMASYEPDVLECVLNVSASVGDSAIDWKLTSVAGQPCFLVRGQVMRGRGYGRRRVRPGVGGAVVPAMDATARIEPACR